MQSLHLQHHPEESAERVFDSRAPIQHPISVGWRALSSVVTSVSRQCLYQLRTQQQPDPMSSWKALNVLNRSHRAVETRLVT